MSAARDVLHRLRALGASVEHSGDRLVLCAGRRPVPAELVEQARAAKPELLVLLASTVAAPKMLKSPEDAHEKMMSILGKNEHLREDGWAKERDERAAVIQYEGGAPRAWAEGLARLDPDQPPGDVPLKRWQRFVDDCGRFLDGGWAARASALGWGALDLFGCDRYRPFARVDRAGLLWLLDGGKIIALAEDVAVIETRTGARQTYRRRSVEPGHAALAWELHHD